MLEFFISWLQEAQTSPSSLFALISAVAVLPTVLGLATIRSVRALSVAKERGKKNYDRAESLLQKVNQLEKEFSEHQQVCSENFRQVLETELIASNFGRATKLCEKYLDRERQNIVVAAEHLARDALVFIYENQELAAERAIEYINLWSALDTRDHVLRLKDSVHAATNADGKRLNARGEAALKSWSLRTPNDAMSLFNKSQVASDEGHHRIAVALLETAIPLFCSKFGQHAEETVFARAALGSEMKSTGKLVESEQFLRKAAADARGHTGADKPATLKIVEAWAEALVFCNEVETALAVHEQNLEKVRATLGWSSKDALLIEAKMARCWIKQEKFQLAEPRLRELLPKLKQCLDLKVHTVLGLEALLADALIGLERVGEAIELYESALKRKTEHLGDKHPDTLVTIHSLARAHMQNGSLDTAETMLQNLWPVEIEVKGSDHQDPYATMAALGLCLSKQEKWEEAEQMFAQALSAHSKLYGSDSLVAATTHCQMAMAIRGQGRLGEAERILCDLIANLSNEEKNTSHLSAIRHELGVTFFEQERFAEAEAEFRAELELQNCQENSNARSRFSAEHAICRCRLEQGNAKEAVEALEALVERMSQEFEPTDELLLRCSSDLALALSHLGKPEQAEQILTDVLGKESQVIGDMDKSTLTTRSNLLATWIDLNRSEEAERAMREHLDIVEIRLGTESKSAISLRHNLASAILEQGRPAEAAATFAEIIPVSKKAFGQNHRNVLYARAMLAQSILEDQRPAEAEWKIGALIPAFSTVLGPSHQYTLALQLPYIRSILEQGRRGEALRFAESHFANLRSLDDKKASDLEATSVLLARINLEMADYDAAEKAFANVSDDFDKPSRWKGAMALIVGAWLADEKEDTSNADRLISMSEHRLAKITADIYPKRE